MKSYRWLIFASAILVSVALLHVWVHLQIIAVGYDLSRETKRAHELAEARQRLSLELRTRMDLPTIERVARVSLHMGPPPAAHVHALSMASEGR